MRKSFSKKLLYGRLLYTFVNPLFYLRLSVGAVPEMAYGWSAVAGMTFREVLCCPLFSR